MKRAQNIKYIFMLVLLAVFLIPSNPVNAVESKQPVYSAQIGQAIEHNCASLKNTLKDLRKRDISSRVARVYVYDFLLLRTDAFTTRLSNNKLDNTKVATSNKALHSTLNKFKTDYNNYDDSLLKLTVTDCQQPSTLYNNLQNTRKLRLKLAQDVKNLNKYWQQLSKDIGSVNLKPSQTEADEK